MACSFCTALDSVQGPTFEVLGALVRDVEHAPVIRRKSVVSPRVSVIGLTCDGAIPICLTIQSSQNGAGARAIRKLSLLGARRLILIRNRCL